MTRTKHPEVTVSRILDVSEQLFLEKGYAQATMKRQFFIRRYWYCDGIKKFLKIWLH